MAIQAAEIKKLYGLAAGRCSICQVNLFENNVHIGEMAHVIAKSKNGARGTEDLTADIHSYENLILLCANHHTEVDQNPDQYTVEKLHSIKKGHENNIASLLLINQKKRKEDISFINLFVRFCQFTYIPVFVQSLPFSVHIGLSTISENFKAAKLSNPHLYPLRDLALGRLFDSFISSCENLWGIVSGYVKYKHSIGSCEYDRTCQIFSQADAAGNIYMKEVVRDVLTEEEYNNLLEAIITLKNSLILAYEALISFIRVNYPEINLTSYNQSC